jgi:hypothetical protein
MVTNAEKGASDRQLVDDREMATALAVTVPQLRKMARCGQIPYVKFSRKLLRFNPAKVFAAIETLAVR